MRSGLVRSVLVCLALLAAPECLFAELVRAGGEFQVNVYAGSQQTYASADLDADGDFVVVWMSLGRDGDSNGIFGRRYDSTGAAIGGEFQVNVFTTGAQSYPSVALAGNGDFVVAWTSFAQDGNQGGIFARRFSASGTPLTGDFQVNSHTVGSQGIAFFPPKALAGPEIAAETNGDFVVTWQSLGQDGPVASVSGVFARRFDAAGNALAPEFQVNVYTTYFQGYPAVAVDEDGGFVVAWQSNLQDGSTTGIFARRFDDAGGSVGGEFQVNARTLSSQRYPTVARVSSGVFVVSWDSYGQDSANSVGVFGRRFGSSGDPVGGDFLVNSYTIGAQRYPSIAARTDGSFVVSWQAYEQDGDAMGIFARRFDSNGGGLATEFQVNSFTANTQRFPAVGGNPSGDFVVAWQSYGQVAGNDIFAQRFDHIAVLDVDGNGATTALGDGIMIMRFLFDFQGPALVANAVDEDNCLRCDHVRIREYLQTLL